MKRILIFTLVLLCIPLIHAKDVTFILDQEEYYFAIGEEANILLETDNTYKNQITGVLKYTITEHLNQGNAQFSSSNTRSSTMVLVEGKGQIEMNFGVADIPKTLTVSMTYTYTGKNQEEVKLENIKIHFVQNQKQKQNKQKETKSSSKKTKQQPPPQPPQPTTQQKLQNNQLTQDSGALKKELYEQLEEQQQKNEAFEQALAQNQEIQQKHEELIEQGYQPTGGNLDAETENTGDFELTYENGQGQKAAMRGSMENNEITNLQVDTEETRQQLLETLQQDKEFQKYAKELAKEGYVPTDTTFSYDRNQTKIELTYTNEQNQTARITAEFEKEELEEIELDKIELEKENYWWAAIAIFLIALGAYLAYNKFTQKKKQPEPKKKKRKSFNYKKTARSLIDKAKKQFAEENYKDAYGSVGQGLRMYLSYENKLNKEITNDEIIKYLRENKKEWKKTKEFFDLCSMVEFAKYEANKRDFDKLVKHAENNIA